MKPALSLPAPDPQSQANSQVLQSRIAEAIEQGAGWISFEAYMALCLYEPQLGYYSSSQEKFGALGDFVTAPMQSALFGHSIAAQCFEWLDQLRCQQIFEFGAGDGQLAAQILNEATKQNREINYVIVELSADLIARQTSTIERLAPNTVHRVTWLSVWPEAINGVILGNELIDAMPVTVFATDSSGQIVNRGVTIQSGRLAWQDKPASSDLSAAVKMAFDAAGWQRPPPDYVSEISPHAAAWIASAAEALNKGVILLLDYGFAATEYYHPQRVSGTLHCHYKHHSHDDPFYLPGLQDITAHVDFSALFVAAQRAGLELLGYTTQGHFLLNLGILQRLELYKNSSEYLRQSQAVSRLISEAEMGELFKVMALAKLPRDQAFLSAGFCSADRSGSL